MPMNSTVNLLWKTRSGTITAGQMTDQQLKAVIAGGLNRAANELHLEGLDNLAAAAGGDDGMAYMAEIHCDAAFDKAAQLPELLKRLLSNPRYAVVLREARHRARRHKAAAAAALS